MANSFKRCLTNDNSFEVAEAELYSAKALESAMTLSLRDDHAIGPPDMNTEYPHVDFGELHEHSSSRVVQNNEIIHIATNNKLFAILDFDEDARISLQAFEAMVQV